MLEELGCAAGVPLTRRDAGRRRWTATSHEMRRRPREAGDAGAVAEADARTSTADVEHSPATATGRTGVADAGAVLCAPTSPHRPGGADRRGIGRAPRTARECLRQGDPEARGRPSTSLRAAAGSLARVWRTPARTSRRRSRPIGLSTRPEDTMNADPSSSEEITAGAARLRVESTAASRASTSSTTWLPRLPPGGRADLARGDAGRAGHRVAPGRREGVALRRARRITFTGPWPAGPIQKVIVARCSRCAWRRWACIPPQRPRSATAGRTSLFLGGESNHGKSDGPDRGGCRRGAVQVSTGDDGHRRGRTRRDGLEVDVFLEQAHRGHRAVRQGRPQRGRREVLRARCRPGRRYEGRPPVDLVIVPAIDGNFDPSTSRMIPFERSSRSCTRCRTTSCTNELLAPGTPMPLVDTEALRRRAGRLRRAASANGPSSSSGLRPPGAPRRGRAGPASEARTMQRVRLRPAGHPRRGGRAARRARTARRGVLAGGTDLIIRLRDGVIRPDGRRRREGRSRSSAPGIRRGRRRGWSSARRRR